MAFVQLARAPWPGLTAVLLLVSGCTSGAGTTTSGPPGGNYCGVPISGMAVFDISQVDATYTHGPGFPIIVVLSDDCKHGASYTIDPVGSAALGYNVAKAKDGMTVAISLIPVTTGRFPLTVVRGGRPGSPLHTLTVHNTS